MELKDRLSDLPDCLLHRIFGFLDFEYCVRASVLSKRWKLLWSSLPYLYFDRSDGYATILSHRVVLKALSRRLQDHDHYRLNKVKLHLKCMAGHSSFLKKITAYLESHQVPCFSISFERNSCFNDVEDFATCFSRSRFLKTLELTRYHGVPISRSDCQPTWTNLYLHECYFCPRDLFSNPFVNCINLKELQLHKCRFSGPAVLNISCPQLVNLVLCDLDLIDDAFVIEILAPKLLSFCLILKSPLHFSALHLPGLDNVDIRIHSPNNLKTLNFQLLIKMFYGLRYAKCVKVCSKTIEMLSTMLPGALKIQTCPFIRLKSLTITGGDGSSNYNNIPANVMAYFLSNSRPMMEE